jgi:hypothetical protein
MAKTARLIMILAILGSMPALGQQDALVGRWQQQDSELVPVHLDLLPDGKFLLTVDTVVDQSTLAATGLFDEQALNDFVARFPFQMQISVSASGAWETAGDQLQIQLQEADIDVAERVENNLAFHLRIKPGEGMDMTTRFLITREFVDLVAGMFADQQPDSLASGGLLDNVVLPDSLDVSLRMGMTWTKVEDSLKVDIGEFDLQLDGMDLETYIAQNEGMVTALVNNIAQRLGEEEGLTGADLEAYKAEMVQQLVADFDQEEFEATMKEEFTSLVDPTEIQTSVPMGMEGAYALAGNTLSITDAEGTTTDWIRDSPSSAVAPASWGRIKVGALAGEPVR